MRLSRAAATVVALALVAGACGGDDDPGGPAATTDRTATTLGSGPGGMDLPSGGELADANAGASGTSGASGAGSGGSGAAEGADRLGAPAVGRYRYDVPGVDDSEYFTFYEDVERRPGELLQLRQVYDTDGDPFDNRYELLWRADGSVVIAREQRSSRGDVGPLCDWEPDLVLYPAGLAPGAEWSASSSCPGRDGATTSVEETGRVTGTETVDVDGRPVDVLVVERTSRLARRIGDIDVAERTVSTERWSSELGLLVRLDSERTADYPGAPTGVRRSAARLLSPVPQRT